MKKFKTIMTVVLLSPALWAMHDVAEVIKSPTCNHHSSKLANNKKALQIANKKVTQLLTENDVLNTSLNDSLRAEKILKDENITLNMHLETCNDELSDLKNQFESEKTHKDEWRIEYYEKERNLQFAYKQIDQLQEALEIRDETLAITSGELKNTRLTNERLSEENKELQKKMLAVQVATKSLNTECKQQSDLNQINKELVKKMDELLAENNRLKNQNAELKSLNNEIEILLKNSQDSGDVSNDVKLDSSDNNHEPFQDSDTVAAGNKNDDDQNNQESLNDAGYISNHLNDDADDADDAGDDDDQDNQESLDDVGYIIINPDQFNKELEETENRINLEEEENRIKLEAEENLIKLEAENRILKRKLAVLQIGNKIISKLRREFLWGRKERKKTERFLKSVIAGNNQNIQEHFAPLKSVLQNLLKKKEYKSIVASFKVNVSDLIAD